MTSTRTPQILFAIGMCSLGILALVFGDFAMVWQPVPAWVPWRGGFAYVSGLLMIVGGVGLVFDRTATRSARILFPYLLLWTLLKVPAVVQAPLVEGNWVGLGELTVLFAGGWVLAAGSRGTREGPRSTYAGGARGIRLAQLLFAVSLPAIGLSHIVYVKQTAELVPAWLPWHTGWAYLTGAAHIAAGFGVLFMVYPRVAATTEAGMLSIFTLLVWIPEVWAAPTSRLPWTEFAISWAITAGAWVVASAIPSHRPVTQGGSPPG
jgi:uncharacterized membrane protein